MKTDANDEQNPGSNAVATQEQRGRAAQRFDIGQTISVIHPLRPGVVKARVVGFEETACYGNVVTVAIPGEGNRRITAERCMKC